MRLRAVLLPLSAIAVPWALVGAFGCGSNVVIIPPGSEEDAGTDGNFVFLDAGDTPDSATDAAVPKDALPDYVDPGCPDQPPPIENYACDPYNQGNGDCLAGEGCYIYVNYPSQPCGQEEYGSYCYLGGTGQQGEGCGGGIDCAGGFVCVVSGSGNQCVELCSLEGVSGCPPGLVCEPIDVEGFGGCL